MGTIVCIFAHPDDEAFGPGGTIAKLAKENTVYIICVTNGDAKQENKQKEKRLGKVRKKELLNSANILGVKEVYFLGYRDGDLCNNLYHDIAEKMKLLIVEIQPVTLLTFEMRGVSGHLDHIAVAMITTFIFEKLSFIKTLWYFCNSDKLTQIIDDYFVYFPKGFKKAEVQKIIDITDVWDTKVQAMHAHQSQQADITWWVNILNKVPKEECFLILRKGIS